MENSINVLKNFFTEKSIKFDYRLTESWRKNKQHIFSFIDNPQIEAIVEECDSEEYFKIIYIDVVPYAINIETASNSINSIINYFNYLEFKKKIRSVNLKKSLDTALLIDSHESWKKLLLIAAKMIYTKIGSLTEHEKELCGVSNSYYQSLRYNL